MLMDVACGLYVISADHLGSIRGGMKLRSVEVAMIPYTSVYVLALQFPLVDMDVSMVDD
jgi:hypothetical protein